MIENYIYNYLKYECDQIVAITNKSMVLIKEMLHSHLDLYIFYVIFENKYIDLN